MTGSLGRLFKKDIGWRPPDEAAPALAARLRPPKRLFGLLSNVAPRESDIMQVAIIPAGQFKPLTPALAPDMQGFAELGEKPRFMIICHRMG
jgi:hypothetical protein